MDVTLRDGSYAINFQFSEYETEKICSIVHESGIDYVEVGHGVGLDGSSTQNGIALCSDEEYLEAARKGSANANMECFAFQLMRKLIHWIN